MNVHEYQAKELFFHYGIPVPRGCVAHHPDEFLSAIDKVDSENLVVKAQIHAGGRGKGHFLNDSSSGIRIVSSRKEALCAANIMFGNTLITHQTGHSGKKVNALYFTEASQIEKEYYLAILFDRTTSKPIIIASKEGGTDIERIAIQAPEKMIKLSIDPSLGLQAYQKRRIAFALGFKEKQQWKEIDRLLTGLYQLFWEKDCLLVEINPLIVTQAGNILALDAKVNFDSNALFRHSDILALRDLTEEDPKEIEASRYNLSYIVLDGNIACLVNGAGLAMATMDIIKHYGGSPANFLDVGGSATVDQVTEAFKIILSDINVKGIFVNIFGGIMSCQTIAEGVVAAASNVSIDIPLVIRLVGNHVEEGKKILSKSNLPLISVDSFADAAQKIVSLVN